MRRSPSCELDAKSLLAGDILRPHIGITPTIAMIALPYIKDLHYVCFSWCCWCLFLKRSRYIK